MKHAWIQTQTGTIGAKATEPLQSATWNLISAVYARYPREARALLRLPIHLDHEPGLICKEVRKVAAKRFAKGISLLPPPIELLTARPPEGALALPTPDAKPLSYWIDAIHHQVLALTQTQMGLKRHERHRPVIAALLRPEGQQYYCLEWAQNTNAQVKNHHAEANLALNWFHKTGGKIPQGSLILVSLQPCRMCSALLSELGHDFSVRYLEADPGPWAKVCWISDSAQIAR